MELCSSQCEDAIHFIQDQIAPDDEMKEYIQESCKDLNEIIDYLKRCK